MNILVCAILKDEDHLYIQEWVDHYLKLGVDQILLIDNDSQYPVKEYVDKNAAWIMKVKVVRSTGAAIQLPMYNMVCSLPTVRSYDWVGFFDLDELLYIKAGLSLAFLLNAVRIFPNCGAVCFNWKEYGTSGRTHFTPEYQRSKFKWHTPDTYHRNRHVKSFVKAEYVKRWRDPHLPELTEGKFAMTPSLKIVTAPLTDEVDWTMGWIDHYYTRSLREWKDKVKRGRADRNDQPYDIDIVNEVDANCTIERQD